MTGPVMEGTGKHTISMKLGQGDADNLAVLCGVARDGVACDKDYANAENTEAWYMDNDGYLWGNGKGEDADGAGEIKEGQVLTMQVGGPGCRHAEVLGGWQASRPWLD